MLKVLYGRLEMNKKSDWLMLSLKLLYMLYTLPFLIFIFLFYIRSIGAFGNPLKEEFGIVKKVLLHFSAIVLSFGLWMAILSIMENAFNIKIRLHLL